MTTGDTLHSLKLTLARWRSPSAWDVVLQDEPLDPPKGEWVSTVATNATAEGTISLTIPNGTMVSATTGGVFMVINSETQLEQRLYAKLERESHRKVLLAIERGKRLNASMGTAAPGQEEDQDTRAPLAYLNSYISVRRGNTLPFARDRKEKRILASLGDKLDAIIRKVERAVGERGDIPFEEWNAAFWEAVTRPRTWDASHRQATSRPR